MGGLSPPLEQQAPHGAHSGKHKCHGVNVQVIADPAGRLIWASPALPGARHDMGAAREHGILDALRDAGVPVVADSGYQGAGATVAVPQRRRRATPSRSSSSPAEPSGKSSLRRRRPYPPPAHQRPGFHRCRSGPARVAGRARRRRRATQPGRPTRPASPRDDRARRRPSPGRAVTATSIAVLVAVLLIGVVIGLGIGCLMCRRSLRPGHHRWPFGPTRR
jgi:hypothetical protein